MINLPINYYDASQKVRAEAREAYIKRQDGNCSHCGFTLQGQPSLEVKMQMKNYPADRFPMNFLANPVHLHHSHNSGKTIGAVHASCNAVLFFVYGE